MHANQLKLDMWANEAQSAVYDYAACFRTLVQASDRLPEQVEFAIGQLQLRAALTSDSALNLIIQLKLWDAEILLRTVAESSLKLTFIAIGNSDEQRVRANEFLVKLPEIAQIKRQRRAEDLLSRVPDREANKWRPIRDVLLSPQQIQAFEARHPKRSRDNLERKWGFARITDELGKSGTAFEHLSAMMYSYGMGSHSVHQDGDSILMMWERERRSEEHLAAVELAHGARGISDVVTFAWLRARAAYKAMNLDTSPIDSVAEKYDSLFDDLHQAHEAFHSVEYSSDRDGSGESAG